MIELNTESYCDECDKFEAETINECEYSFYDGLIKHRIIVQCEHYDLCRHLWESLLRGKSNKEEK